MSTDRAVADGESTGDDIERLRAESALLRRLLPEMTLELRGNGDWLSAVARIQLTPEERATAGRILDEAWSGPEAPRPV